jgi:hypothetical protein
MRRLDSPSFQFTLGDREHVLRQLELSFRGAVSKPLLEDVVRAFTRRARSSGQTVERVIIALKDMALMASRATHSPESVAEMNEDVVRWCLAEYFSKIPAPSLDAD